MTNTQASNPNCNENFYYWLYEVTQDQITEIVKLENENKMANVRIGKKDTNPEVYFWNRWMITGLFHEFSCEPGDIDCIEQLQRSIDETTPSWVINPMCLKLIKEFSSPEKDKLLKVIREKSGNYNLEFPSKYEVNFSKWIWQEAVFFYGFIFPKAVNFKNSEFKEDANFVRSKFFDKALFDHSEFHKNTFFSAARFSETASFLGVKFATDNFVGNTGDYIKIKNQKPNIQASEVRFIEATFLKKTSFYNTEFQGSVLFLEHFFTAI